ncbi:MAG TPA: ATP-dependent DNA helicase [Vicinamibacterales bacterium]|jgi:ATP-dependent DNA helicase DinG|nr:ATP-dependent DNA helicase [Vicinamibacterales bacterium]
MTGGASRLAVAAAADAVFAEDGALAAALDDFEPRASQRKMAAAVAGIIAEGGTLVAEAGTGTGKTLAYLIPAILSGRRVLVSTGTKNLQEQIFFKDLPVLRSALGPRFASFKAVCMKGRGNYLCLHRFDEFRANPTFRMIEERGHLSALEQWARTTDTGDRAELESLPEDLSFWSDVAATSDHCLGSGCPRYQECYVTRLRQQAAEADIVIVNHHLLCADAAVRQSTFGEVIPDCHVAIVDEAHQLEEIATQYFGIAVSNYRVDELSRDAERALAMRHSPEIDKTRVRELRDDVHRLKERSAMFFAAIDTSRFMLRSQSGASGPQDERTRLTPSFLQRIAEEGRDLVEALETLQGGVALLKEAPEELLAVGRRAGELREDLSRLLRADDPAFVFFLETRGRGVFLRAAPIDVSAVIREMLMDRMHATVLTSATLAVDGGFGYVRGRLGLRQASELQLPSEFDFGSQAILYLPRRMPDPRSPAFSEAAGREILEILRRTRGRAFALFTSYATLRQVQRLLERSLEYPLLVQGTAPRSALLNAFRTTPNAVLLATSSFWQGVDVVGEALSCVIIDKLPFASPGDPIMAARVEAIRASGGEPFSEYQVPLAILTLKQGLGRLIRHRRDRGVLAVLDPRLRTMAYGRRFLDALPAAPLTHDIEDIARFLS